MKSENKRVYRFGDGQADATGSDSDLKALLGGKGLGLAQMSRLGIPVPPGLIITTDVCRHFMHHDGALPDGIDGEVRAAVAWIGEKVGATFADSSRPLLVSVRSGARVSMPGMMDTVLNLGLNDAAVETLAKSSGNPRFAYDAYRRFVQMYGDVVLGMKPEKKTDIDPFEEILEKKKHAAKVELDSDLSVAQLKELVAEFKAAVKAKTGKDFPTDRKSVV